jgi:RNA polymerase sigma-70 factor, ECF subfamily
VPSADELRIVLDAAREGDETAMAELVRRTQPAVWRVCLALGSAGEEEDLVQETYLRALRSLRSYRGEASVAVWLLSIARRVCADHVRRRDKQRRILQRLHLDSAPQRSLVAGSVVTQHHRGDPQHQSVVDDLVQRLKPDQREAFVLTQLVGLSYAEAAAVADCAVGTIRSRVARARAELLAIVRQAEAR